MADSSLNVIVRLVDNASSGLKGLAGQFDNANKKISESTAGAQTFTKAVAAVGVAAGTYATVQFANFEAGMSAVKAVTGATGDEFVKLGDKAKQIGADTAFSQLEIAGAMEELGKNGLTSQQILGGAIDATAALAAAAGTDLTSAAVIASSAMNTYNISAEQMKLVTNSIVGVANGSKLSVEDFGDAMSQGGGVAKQVGVEFEDFSAVIAATANTFKGGSDAGTSMKTFLQSLVPASDGAAAAMESIWFSAYDANGNLKSMEDIAQNLQNGLSGLSEEQKNYALKTIFGSDASRMAGAMAEQGAAGIKKMKDVIANTDAEAQAATRMDNLKGSWEKLMGTVDVAATAVGEQLAGVLRPAIEGINSAIEDLGGWFNSLSPAMKDTITVIGTVAGVLGGLVLVVGSVGLVLGPVITAFSTVLATFSAISAVIGTVVGWFTSLVAVFNPVTIAIMAIVAVIGVLYLAWQNNWFGMRDIVNNVVNAVVWFFTGLWTRIQEIGNQVWQFLTDMWNGILTTAETVWNGIVSVVTTVSRVLLALILVMVDGILNLFWTNLAEVVNIVMNLWTLVSTVTATAWAGITAAITAVWNWIKAVFTAAGAAVKTTFETTWNALKALATSMGDAVKGIVSTMWDGITGFFSKGIESASQAWSNFSEGLSNVMMSTWQNIKNTIAAGINWIIDKANAVIRSINSATETVGFRVPEIPRVAFQHGGIVPGGVNPASHDKVYAALDPGELILNRAQQSNIAAQLENGWKNAGGGVVVNIAISGNAFHGADPEYAENIADMIFERFNTHQALPYF